VIHALYYHLCLIACDHYLHSFPTRRSSDLREVKQIGFANANEIAARVIGSFERGEFDVCTLFYSQFKSVISQIPTAKQIIPAAAPEVEVADTGAIYDYEPDAGAILEDLIPRNIAVQIFRALLENAAGEMG